MRMRRLLVVLAALAVVLASAVPAAAVTHAPCAGHYVTAPYVALVDDGVTTLQGAGGIGGCPAPAGTESVTITVALQRLVDGVWVDQVAGSGSRSWNRYSRYARTYGLSVTAVCELGDWRTDVRGGDGFEPSEWVSDPVTMVGNDSGVCGVNTGGGD